MVMVKEAQTLSLERKLKMYEAREALLNKVGAATFSVIDLDHFLQATVNEVGKIMGVDRCDIMMLTGEGELRITHEFRTNGHAPSSLGFQVPVDVSRLQENVDFYSPQAFDDTSSPHVTDMVRQMTELTGTR